MIEVNGMILRNGHWYREVGYDRIGRMTAVKVIAMEVAQYHNETKALLEKLCLF